MRLLLVSPHVGGGHHTAYLEAVGREALRRQWTIVLALADNQRNHPALDRIRDVMEQSDDVFYLPTPRAAGWLPVASYIDGQVKRRGFVRRAVAAASTKRQLDAVFVVDCDSWYPASAMLGCPSAHIPLTSVAFRIRFHHASAGIRSQMGTRAASLQRFLLQRFLRSPGLGRLIVTDDDQLAPHLASRNEAIAQKVLFVPELADMPSLPSPQIARERLGFDSASTVVLSFGAQTARKGLAQLIAAASHSQRPTTLKLLIAGSQDRAAQAILASPAALRLQRDHRLYTISRYLTSDEMADAFAAADIAWLGYQDHSGPSAFLWQATAAGLPVVATNEGLIGYWVKRAQLGVTTNTSDPLDVARALSQAVELAPRDDVQRAAWASKARAHSPQAFGASVCDAIELPLLQTAQTNSNVRVPTCEPS